MQYALSIKIILELFFAVNLNEFMTGVGYGWIAPTLVNLQRGDSEFSFSAEDASWLASFHEVSHTIGPLFSAILLDRIGRKNCFIITSFLTFAVWLMNIFTRSISLIYVARIIFGLAISLNDVASSVYLAENCSPNIRGIIGSLLPLCYYAGVFVEYIIATYLTYRTVAIVNTTLAFITLLSIFLLKETPYYLVLKGHHEAAEKNFMWLSGNTLSKADIQKEVDCIKENIQMEKLKKKSYLSLFSSPQNYKTVSVIFIMNLTMVLTGYYSINSYASTVFLPTNTFTANEFTILLGIIQFAAACIAPFIVERFNRRTLVIILFLAMATSHGSTFILFTTEFISRHNIYFPWLLFTFVIMYSVTMAIIYPVVFIIRGELLPISVKAVGGFLTVSVDSLTSFVTIYLFPIITKNYGIEFNFLLYFIAGILGCVHVYWTLPETRGKTLVDIQKSLEEP